LAYNSYEDRLLPLVGLNFSHSRSLSSLVIFDGAAISPRLTHAWARRFFCAGLFK